MSPSMVRSEISFPYRAVLLKLLETFLTFLRDGELGSSSSFPQNCVLLHSTVSSTRQTSAEIHTP